MNDTPGRVLILHHDQVRVQDKVPVCHNQRAQLKCKKLPDIKNKVIPVIWVFCAMYLDICQPIMWLPI
jgi:hypothetical protein